MKDIIFTQKLQSILTARIFGKHICYLAEIDSTNNFALQKAKEGAPEGTVVLADYQSHGRGQGDHTWYSPHGGIYLSIILRPKVSPPDINSWNVMAGLAVIRTLQDYGEENISLKSPNDVLISGRKVAGILTEMRGGCDYINYLVMGIGINVNFEMQKIPKELRSQVATIRLKGPGDSARITFLHKLLENLERSYFSFIEKMGETASSAFSD